MTQPTSIDEVVEEFEKTYRKEYTIKSEPSDYIHVGLDNSFQLSDVKNFLREKLTTLVEQAKGENKSEVERLRSALDWIALVSNIKNPHLGRPRSSDSECLFCMAYLALNDGAYGEHIDYAQLAKTKREGIAARTISSDKK